jgi:glutamine amidotransferase
MNEVTVIDYGVGNLLSVRRALEHCGARVTITSDIETILASAKLLLPGVGAFADGMAALQAKRLDTAVHQAAMVGTPLLGICLGMQMLFDESDEFGTTLGLGLIPGRVIQIPAKTTTSETNKIPHIGWNQLLLPNQHDSWQSSLLADVVQGDSVYFVHSYMAVPASPKFRLADCNYGSIPIAAAVQKDNVVGCQFHPEKSGDVGLKILRRFISQ